MSGRPVAFAQSGFISLMSARMAKRRFRGPLESAMTGVAAVDRSVLGNVWR
jgi:hypothetical protein